MPAMQELTRSPTLDPHGFEPLSAHAVGLRRVSTPIEDPETGYEGDDEQISRIVEEEESGAEADEAPEEIWNPFRAWLSTDENLLEPPIYSPSNYSGFDSNATTEGRTGFYLHNNDGISNDELKTFYRASSSSASSSTTSLVSERILDILEDWNIKPSIFNFDKFNHPRFYRKAARIFDPSASGETFRNPFTEDLPSPIDPGFDASPKGQEIETEDEVFRSAAKRFFAPLDVDSFLALQRGSAFTLQSTDEEKSYLTSRYNLLPHEPLEGCCCHWCETFFFPTPESFEQWRARHDPNPWCHCPLCLLFRSRRSDSRHSNRSARIFPLPSPELPPPTPRSPRPSPTQLNRLQLAEEARFAELGALNFDFDALRSPKLREGGEEAVKKEKKGRKGLLGWVRNQLRSEEGESDE